MKCVATLQNEGEQGSPLLRYFSGHSYCESGASQDISEWAGLQQIPPRKHHAMKWNPGWLRFRDPFIHPIFLGQDNQNPFSKINIVTRTLLWSLLEGCSSCSSKNHLLRFPSSVVGNKIFPKWWWTMVICYGRICKKSPTKQTKVA